ASYVRAGSHLRSIWGPQTRLSAEEVSAELAGVQVLDLATVTARGEPRVAPVDGLFYRGRFWFGSAQNSARFRNIRRNPAGSGARPVRAPTARRAGSGATRAGPSSARPQPSAVPTKRRPASLP